MGPRGINFLRIFFYGDGCLLLICERLYALDVPINRTDILALTGCICSKVSCNHVECMSARHTGHLLLCLL